MAKVIITANVEDAKTWETNFKTHTALFKTYGLMAPVDYTLVDNELTICMEPGNAEAFIKLTKEQPTLDAMKFDGVKSDTVKIVVLDKAYAI
jgi:hypothetical protein